MPYDPNLHHRHSIRLRDYDYALAGAYFITICAHDHALLFGNISNDQMRLNALGLIVDEEWHRSAEIRREIMLDAWTVMPNHVHGIVIITNIEVTSAPAGVRPHAPTPDSPPNNSLGGRPKSLSSFVIGFKSATKMRVNDLRQTPRAPVWQRNYYERIIRNEREMQAIREYIEKNPLQWALDRENPDQPHHM